MVFYMLTTYFTCDPLKDISNVSPETIVSIIEPQVEWKIRIVNFERKMLIYWGINS